ncbi:MAG: hypothetical protein ACK4ZM_01000 [bacterium]
MSILNTFIDEKDRIYLILEGNEENIHIFQISDNKQEIVFELTAEKNEKLNEKVYIEDKYVSSFDRDSKTLEK